MLRTIEIWQMRYWGIHEVDWSAFPAGFGVQRSIDNLSNLFFSRTSREHTHTLTHKALKIASLYLSIYCEKYVIVSFTWKCSQLLYLRGKHLSWVQWLFKIYIISQLFRQINFINEYKTSVQHDGWVVCNLALQKDDPIRLLGPLCEEFAHPPLLSVYVYLEALVSFSRVLP